MRGVITDEYKILEETLNGEIKNVMNSQNILIKKCIEDDMSKEATTEFVLQYLKKIIKNYSIKKNRDNIINSYSHYKKNNKNIIKIKNVDITENEWNNIIQLNNENLERIAFIMLIYEKINEHITPECNGWINISGSNIFRESIKNHKITYNDFLLLLNKLLKLEYISQKNSNASTAIHINYLESGNVKFKIEDFENVISYYDENRYGIVFSKCKECGIRIEQNSKKQKLYCKRCAKKIRNEMNKENMKKYRNVVK